MNPFNFKKSLLSVVFVLLASVYLNANILYVDNSLPTPTGAYATISAAHTAAVAGDTIYLIPSEMQYDGITITKKLHFFGNGFNRPGSGLSYTKLNTITFGNGGQGSTLTSASVSGGVNINCNDILIRRCFIGSRLTVDTNKVQISILQNIIKGSIVGPLVYCKAGSQTMISNNHIYNILYNTGSSIALQIDYPATTTCNNNVFTGANTYMNGNHAVVFGTSGTSYISHSFNNNIIYAGLALGISNSNNNLCNSSQLPATYGNLQNINMVNVFANWDSDLTLKTGSPAIGAGFNETDCGIYGGVLGFKTNGEPPLPYIYYLDVPSAGNTEDGINVTIKVRSSN